MRRRAFVLLGAADSPPPSDIRDVMAGRDLNVNATRRLQHPDRISNPVWNFVVLGIAAVAEGVSMRFALQKFWRSLRPGEHWWSSLRTSKDPTVFIVVAEDAAALSGLTVAAVGLILEYAFQSIVPDAIASILIGLILSSVAILMAIETQALLLGESADPEIVAEILEVVQKDHTVAHAHPPLTMHFGPNEILVNMSVSFKEGTSSEDILNSIATFESAIREKFPSVRRIFIEAESLRSGKHKKPAA